MFITRLLSFIIDLGIILTYPIYRIFYRKNDSNSYVYSLKIRIYSKIMCKNLNCKNVIFRDKVNIICGYNKIKIGTDTTFGKSLILTALGDKKNINDTIIQIGNNCNFGDYNHITSIKGIYIGNSVLTGRWVTITDNSHGEIIFDQLLLDPSKRKLVSKGCVHIGDRVWIGDKVTILPGVSIGEGSVIGSNCVVSKNVPPYSVCVGASSRIIKHVTSNYE